MQDLDNIFTRIRKRKLKGPDYVLITVLCFIGIDAFIGVVVSVLLGFSYLVVGIFGARVQCLIKFGFCLLAFAANLAVTFGVLAFFADADRN